MKPVSHSCALSCFYLFSPRVARWRFDTLHLVYDAHFFPILSISGHSFRKLPSFAAIHCGCTSHKQCIPSVHYQSSTTHQLSSFVRKKFCMLFMRPHTIHTQYPLSSRPCPVPPGLQAVPWNTDERVPLHYSNSIATTRLNALPSALRASPH